MKRKNFISKLLGATLCIMLLATAALNAQEKMPITTSSQEAREVYVEGVDIGEKGNIPQMIGKMEQAIQLDSEFAMAYLYLSLGKAGGSWFSPEPLYKAVELSNQVSEGEKHMILLARAIREGKEKDMRMHSRSLAKLHSKDERALAWAGWSHFMQNNYRKALRLFKRSAQLNDQYAPVFNMLGYTYMKMEKNEKADQALKKYMELQPGVANPRHSYANFLRTQGRFDEAIEYYKMALKYDPNFTISYRGLGDSYLFKGEYELAREHYKNYYEHASNNNMRYSSLILQATVALHENKPELALRVMDRYIKLAEELDNAYHKVYGRAYKAGILNETGQPEKALSHYRQAMKVAEKEDRNDDPRRHLITMAHLWEFYALASNGDMDKAEAVQNKCKKMITEIENLYHRKVYNASCGVMELNKGNYRQARKYLSKASEGPLTWYYTGLAWEKSGNQRKARKCYEKVANHYNNWIELAIFRNKALAGLEE